MEKLNVIITGASGMVGEGVLFESLHHPNVENVLVITRKPTGYNHPRLKEIIHNDFFNITPLRAQLKGYNACYFCLGVTSVGKNETAYARLTYALTMHFATLLASLNHNMTFCYISGAGTDSTEKGKVMWARVKGKTENELLKLPFKRVYNFRPAAIEPFLPLRPGQTYYRTLRLISWMFPMMKVIAPNYITTLKELAKAMINASLFGYTRNILEVKDIKLLAKKSS
jgi:nucleoside-diphosphate-sugar epimerase